MADIGNVIQQYGLSRHSYADDNQLYSSCNQHVCVALKSRMIKCMESIGEWMKSIRPLLNQSKSEFMWCASQRRTHHIDRWAFDLPMVQWMFRHHLAISGIFRRQYVHERTCELSGANFAESDLFDALWRPRLQHDSWISTLLPELTFVTASSPVYQSINSAVFSQFSTSRRA